MRDEESAANRWLIRLLKLLVFGGAAGIVVWYAMQFRGPRGPNAKTPAQHVATLRNHDEKTLVRRVAAEAIGRAELSVADDLAAELAKGDAVGRELAAFVLGRLEAENPGAVNGLIAALDDPKPEVRKQAAIALGRLGARPAEVAAALACSVRDGDPEIRRELFTALRRLDDAGRRELLGLLAEADADVRRRALIELGRVGRSDGDLLDSLRGCLRDADPRVRAEALAGLWRRSASRIDDLIDGLHDDDPLVRDTACTLLGRMGREAKPAAPEILKVFANDASRNALRALQNSGMDNSELTAQLAPLLDSENERTADETVHHMGQLGRANEGVRDRLRAHVDSPRHGMAVWAFVALRATGLEGQMRPPELIDALEAAGDEVHSLILWDPSAVPSQPVRSGGRNDEFVRGYGVTDQDLARLAGLRQLRLLDLRENPVSDAGLKHVAVFKELERLSLSKTKVTSAGLAQLAALTKLRRLSLTDCEIDDAGLADLKNLTSLEFLELDNTKVTDAGMHSLAGLARLKEVRLYGTKVTDAGLAHLSALAELEGVGYAQHFTLRGLSQLKRLHAVRPARESVVDDDLALLVDMPRLRELILSGSAVTDAGLAHVGKLTQLESLQLGQTAITDAGLANLRSLVNLKYLNLAGTHTTQRGLESLEKSLPNLKSPLVHGNAPLPAMNTAYEVVGLKSDEEPDAAPSHP